jgi:hypothetical protein
MKHLQFPLSSKIVFFCFDSTISVSDEEWRIGKRISNTAAAIHLNHPMLWGGRGRLGHTKEVKLCWLQKFVIVALPLYFSSCKP